MITRILNYIDGGKLKVHMWGRCHSKECDWGEVTASLDPNDKNILLLNWDHKTAIRTQKLTLGIDGTLQLWDQTIYNDNSGRMRETRDVYVNGLKHDWTDPPARDVFPQ